MKKIIKISTTIIISILLMILAMSNISYGKTYDRNVIPSAKDAKLGDSCSIDYNGYESSSLKSRLFCVEHHEHLYSEKYGSYQIINKISISEDVAIGYKYKAIKEDASDKSNYKIKTFKNPTKVKYGKNGEANGENRKLAAALYYSKELGNISDRREAVWYYTYNWVKKINNKFTGVNKSLVNPDNDGISDEIASAVKDYVKSEGEGKEASATFKNVDAEQEVKVKKYKVNGKDVKYTKIGPFTAKFSPKLDSMKVYGIKKGSTEEKEITSFKIQQGAKVYNNVEDIKSNTPFYILIKSTKKITQISNIKIKTKKPEAYVKNIKATIAFLKITKRQEDALQNFAIIDTSADEVKPDPAEAEYKHSNSDISGGDFAFKVYKVSEDDLQPIKDAKFKIYELRPYTTTNVQVYTGNVLIQMNSNITDNNRETVVGYFAAVGAGGLTSDYVVAGKRVWINETDYANIMLDSNARKYITLVTLFETRSRKILL